jgi:hypothetical protein
MRLDERGSLEQAWRIFRRLLCILRLGCTNERHR